MPDVILGRDSCTDSIIRISDKERRSGQYMLGRMGQGKTSLMKLLIEQDMEHGHGVFFLDPHGDAVEELQTRIPSHRKNDVIVLDPSDELYSFGINPLACPDSANMTERSRTYAQAFDIFKKLFANIQTGELDILLNTYLRNSFFPLIANQGYTLLEIPLLLEEKSFRDRILQHPSVRREVADFWHTTFDLLRSDKQREEIASTKRRLDQFQDYDEIRHIVGQSTSTIDFVTIMQERKILFVKLKKTLPGDAWRIIGTLLVSNLVHAVREREHLPEAERHQFCIFVDEFQNFASSDDFAVLFTEARKYGIATTIAHQERYGQFADNKRIAGATDAAVIKIFFMPTPNDATEQAVEFAARATPTELHREAELVISPHPVEDLWERGHSNEKVMEIRNNYFWIVDLLKKNPHEKYFVYQGGMKNDGYRSSADMLREGITLLNQYLFNKQTEKTTRHLEEIVFQLIQCWGGVLGFLPTMEHFIPDEKRTRLLQLRNEKFKRDYEQEKRDYEQKKRDLIQEQKDKIQSAKDEIQYLKEYGIKAFFIPSRIPGNPSGSNSYYRVMPNGAKIDVSYKEKEAQERQIKALSDKILTLEQSPLFLPLTPSLRSINVLPRNIDDIHTVAIESGMAYHEIESLVEWRIKTFDQEYTEEQLRQIRIFYQALEKLTCYLKEKPIKIPSGHYDESLKVDRTQQDLNNDMVQELLDLQPHNAYVKSASWKGKIQTVVVDEAAAALLSAGGRELVDVRTSARQNAIWHGILKLRSEVEKDIRERQEKLREGPDEEPSPPTSTSGNTPPALPAGSSGQEPPPPTHTTTDTPPEPTGKKKSLACRQTGLPVEFVSLHFFESGSGMPPKGQRSYSTSFSQHTARFVSFELTMRTRLESVQSTRVRVRTHYYLTPATTLFKRQEEDHVVYADADSRPYQWGFGAAQPGSWKAGVYRVVIFIDGVEFAEGTFTISEARGMDECASASQQPSESEGIAHPQGRIVDFTSYRQKRHQTITDAAHTTKDSLIPLTKFPVALPEPLATQEVKTPLPAPSLYVSRTHPLEATVSNPHYTSDLKLLDRVWDRTAVINSQTIILVVGADVAAELLDRPVAARLRDEIDKRGDVTDCRRAIILTDVLWFKDATLHTQPVIAIGGPSSNALTAALAHVDDRWETPEGFEGSFIQGPPPQITLWGQESAQVRDHVEAWIKNPNGLSYFLTLCWQ
jgi:hypothetical protein